MARLFGCGRSLLLQRMAKVGKDRLGCALKLFPAGGGQVRECFALTLSVRSETGLRRLLSGLQQGYGLFSCQTYGIGSLTCALGGSLGEFPKRLFGGSPQFLVEGFH